MRVNEILLVESDDRCVLTSRKRLDDAGKTADKQERLDLLAAILFCIQNCTRAHISM